MTGFYHEDVELSDYKIIYQALDGWLTLSEYKGDGELAVNISDSWANLTRTEAIALADAIKAHFGEGK